MPKLPALLVTLSLLCIPAAAQRTCEVSSYGSGCGPKLTAAVTPNGGTVRIRLTITGAAPGAVVIMAIGDHPLDLPVVGAAPGCRWYVNPVFIQFHRVSEKTGLFSHSRAVSATFLGTYYAQFVELGDPAHTTNGIEFECK